VRPTRAQALLIAVSSACVIGLHSEPRSKSAAAAAVARLLRRTSAARRPQISRLISDYASLATGHPPADARTRTTIDALRARVPDCQPTLLVTTARKAA
jgi:hypothetical protein